MATITIRELHMKTGHWVRAADAMHLACASANGLREVFTNDRHMLAACPAFGLKGRHIIG